MQKILNLKEKKDKVVNALQGTDDIKNDEKMKGEDSSRTASSILRRSSAAIRSKIMATNKYVKKDAHLTILDMIMYAIVVCILIGFIISSVLLGIVGRDMITTDVVGTYSVNAKKSTIIVQELETPNDYIPLQTNQLDDMYTTLNKMKRYNISSDGSFTKACVVLTGNWPYGLCGDGQIVDGIVKWKAVRSVLSCEQAIPMTQLSNTNDKSSIIKAVIPLLTIRPLQLDPSRPLPDAQFLSTTTYLSFGKDLWNIVNCKVDALTGQTSDYCAGWSGKVKTYFRGRDNGVMVRAYRSIDNRVFVIIPFTDSGAIYRSTVFQEQFKERAITDLETYGCTGKNSDYICTFKYKRYIDTTVRLKKPTVMASGAIQLTIALLCFFFNSSFRSHPAMMFITTGRFASSVLFVAEVIYDSNTIGWLLVYSLKQAQNAHNHQAAATAFMCFLIITVGWSMCVLTIALLPCEYILPFEAKKCVTLSVLCCLIPVFVLAFTLDKGIKVPIQLGPDPVCGDYGANTCHLVEGDAYAWYVCLTCSCILALILNGAHILRLKVLESMTPNSFENECLDSGSMEYLNDFFNWKAMENTSEHITTEYGVLNCGFTVCGKWIVRSKDAYLYLFALLSKPFPVKLVSNLHLSCMAWEIIPHTEDEHIWSVQRPKRINITELHLPPSKPIKKPLYFQ